MASFLRLPRSIWAFLVGSCVFLLIYITIYWGAAGVLYGDGRLIRLKHHLMQPTSYALWCWIIGSKVSVGFASSAVILIAILTKLGLETRIRALGVAVAVAACCGVILLWISQDPRHPLSPIPFWSWLRGFLNI
ncbi:MAG: hypothetical protein HUU55_13980 [Myxococcales bacterium]|nr:hypothetical protein [Myxococcales bacterium]